MLPAVEKGAAVFIGSTKAGEMKGLMQALLENPEGN